MELIVIVVGRAPLVLPVLSVHQLTAIPTGQNVLMDLWGLVVGPRPIVKPLLFVTQARIYAKAMSEVSVGKIQIVIQTIVISGQCNVLMEVWVMGATTTLTAIQAAGIIVERRAILTIPAVALELVVAVTPNVLRAFVTAVIFV